MCGIVGQFISVASNIETIKNAVDLMAHRGPDANGVFLDAGVIFGHTRLSIIDISNRSNQPFTYGETTISFNGEIWNHVELRKELQFLGLRFRTKSDTEVVAAVLDKYGSQGLNKLRGMFAIAWKRAEEKRFFLARDIFGEIPIHFIPKYPFQFCSELKILKKICRNFSTSISVPPGSFIEVEKSRYSVRKYSEPVLSKSRAQIKEAGEKTCKFLAASVNERTISDVPICTLLSGGIDSSIITYLLSMGNLGLVAYTAVYNEKSNDLKYARKLAKILGIELREVKIPKPSKKDLVKIIEIIEMPYKAQIEIGWICYWLAKKIREDGFKVVFSGEGSDELLASYAFSYYSLKTQDFQQYRKDLFLTQERKNFCRTNKIFMHFGVESRLPFLNKELVEFLLSLPVEIVRDGKNLKNILSTAFCSTPIPQEILYRPKVAFQDGAGIKEDIQELFGGKQQAMSFYRGEYKRLYLSNSKGFGL